jgi:hypothetical protein
MLLKVDININRPTKNNFFIFMVSFFVFFPEIFIVFELHLQFESSLLFVLTRVPKLQTFQTVTPYEAKTGIIIIRSAPACISTGAIMLRV